MRRFETLADVRNFLDNIDEINCGGCGLAALAMYRWLQKENKLFGDESFTFLYKDKDFFYKNNSNVLKNSVGFFNSATHIMFYCGGYHYDTHRDYISSAYTERHEGVTEPLLVEALNYGGWNSDFDRSHYLHVIEEKLEIDFSDVSRGEF